ncbi:MAG: alpha/beta hydrolase fold domain-containing protein [Nocardioidaceae bacterium]
MSFLRRQIVTAALTANALRPVPGYYAGIPAMFGGWLTSELAPHLLALTVADTALHLTPKRRNRHALALAAGSTAGLVAMIVQAEQAKGHLDRALTQALGDDYRDLLTATYTDIDLATPIAQLAMPFRQHSDEVEVLKDIRYADHGRRGLLDVYRRRDTDGNNAPVLLQVHGGGWTIGNKDEQGIPLMRHMAARGWVCVAINYRLSPRSPFPDHIVDVKRAIAWIRAHGGEYGADPSYIAVTGGSAGGHLTALAALTANDPEYQPGFEDADTTVQAAVPHYGVYDLAGVTGKQARQMRDRFLGPRVLFKDPREELEAFERASPLFRVNPDAPPFLIIHGTHDSLVPAGQAREFAARLRAVGRQPVAYAELPGTQHAFDVFPSIRSAHVVRAVDRFLRWNYARAVHAASEHPSR